MKGFHYFTISTTSENFIQKVLIGILMISIFVTTMHKTPSYTHSIVKWSISDYNTHQGKIKLPTMLIGTRDIRTTTTSRGIGNLPATTITT